MQTVPEVIEVEELAKAAGIPMPRVLGRAGVAVSTYWRWRRAGTDPQTSTIRKLKAAIVELSAEAA